MIDLLSKRLAEAWVIIETLLFAATISCDRREDDPALAPVARGGMVARKP